MARSCGLRLGPRRFELVVLEGSAKKHKITAWMVGELPRPSADKAGDGAEVDPSAAASAILKEAARKHAIPRDSVGLAIDAGLAAFRTLRMPFSDESKIEQVLKFEVESLLPQWSIDDIVVDFHVLDSAGDSSELLITAVPKQDLRRLLGVCERAGIEPQEAELETSAMVNAALAAEICKADEAQILVHIGEQSTSVVVVDGAKVREMRAIHIGALASEMHAGTPAAEGDATALLPAGDAPTGVSGDSGATGAAGATGDAGATAEAAATTVAIPDEAELQRRLDQAIKRIRRELGRTVSAARTTHPITGIHVCGLEVPGLVGSSVLDVPVHLLDVFDEDMGQPAEGSAELVVPYGVALRQLGGGVLEPSLRREELRFTGAFERIELPLAVVCLLAVTLLGVWNIFLYKESTFVDAHLAAWRDRAKMFLVGDLKGGKRGVLSSPSERVKKYTAEINADVDRDKYEQLRHVQSMLFEEVKKLEKDLGQDAEITQPQSALTALTLVLGIVEKQGSAIARPSLRKVTAVYTPGRSGKPESVKITLDLTIFAESAALATNFYDGWVRDLQAQPWFVDLEERQSQSLEDGLGIYLPGVGIVVDVSKAPKATQ